MTVWLVIWICLMIIWLVFGCYGPWDPVNGPRRLGTTLIPWACVLILGLILFGAVGGGPAVVGPPVRGY